MRVILIASLFILTVSLFGNEKEEKITTHTFGETEIGATKDRAMSLKVDVLKITNSKTQVNTKENFLVEMSESIADID
ncbi:hypothetical protein JXR93_05525 [bacterium]|nr:hypothetical protein [bacterium]